MKILLIGQLPQETGGNYTTGAANVVYEISKQTPTDVEYFTFGTNIPERKAKEASLYSNQYNGYGINLLRIIWNIVRRPRLSLQHISHYIRVDHQNFFRYLLYEDNIRAVIKRVRPDLIHVNSIYNISPTRHALGKHNIPILLTCHGIFYNGSEKDTVNRDRYLGNIKLVDAYSGLTKESLEEYESILGIYRDQVAVVPNGVDCKKFYFSARERESIRKKYNAPGTCRVFITVASVQERKGQLDFLKLLSKSDFDFQYWIVGKGPGEEPILRFIQENNLQNKVKLLGYIQADELYRYYSAADIYAHPSWKEGQALSELEANATGLRTIVNKAIINTIANDVTTSDYYVLDFENVNMVTFSEWVLSSSKERVSRSNFDWKIIAEKYSELYHKILNTR